MQQLEVKNVQLEQENLHLSQNLSLVSHELDQARQEISQNISQVSQDLRMNISQVSQDLSETKYNLTQELDKKDMQIGFFGELSGYSSSNTLRLIYDSARSTNYGGGFSYSTGQFVAPVAGLYYLSTRCTAYQDY